MRYLILIEQFRKDIQFGARSFLRTPTLSLLALLSLALGVGATTAIFSAAYSIIIDPFPYGDARHLLLIQVQQEGDSQPRIGFSSAQFVDLTRGATTFSSLAGSVWSEVALTGKGEPERLDGVSTSTNIFQVLQVAPLLGRGFVEGDTSPDAPSVVVLSYKFWQRAFGADTAIVGKQIRINDQVRTVVGVMPERVYWLEADVYMPVDFAHGRSSATGYSVLIVGRLKNGVAKAEAETNLQSAFREMLRRDPAQFPDHWRAACVPFPDAFPTKIKNELLMLLGAVGLLLLIACANVSSLLVSKASARQKEMAIRASLGASRGAIVRQLLTESLLLAMSACLLGLVFASLGLRLILSLVPPDTIPIEAKISLNMPALLFSLAVAVCVAMIAGIVPAMHAIQEGLAASLRESGRGAGGSKGQTAFREVLVVIEVSLSMVLLVGATLMLRTVFALQHVPLGMNPDQVLIVNVPLPDNRYKGPVQRAQALRKYLAVIRQTPGVTAASLNTRPHPFENARAAVEVEGRARLQTGAVLIQQTDDQYLRVLSIPLVAGRTWTEAEVVDQRRLAIVNQSFARSYLSGRPLLGAPVSIPSLQDFFGKQPFQIIGVVADVLNQGLAKTAAPEIYLPYTLYGSSDNLVIRTSGEPMSVARVITARIHSVDAQQPVTKVMSMESALSSQLLSLSRFQMTLFSLFAATGLALAIAGIYGVVSNSVERRTPEMGVRLALGARSDQIVGLVLKSGMRLVWIGLAAGLAGALVVTRFMASFLFGVLPADLLSFGAVALTVSTVGAIACLWPACRAARIDAVRSLRQE